MSDDETRPARTAYDVIVVGARAAGASTALLLARAGLSVLVVDRGLDAGRLAPVPIGDTAR